MPKEISIIPESRPAPIIQAAPRPIPKRNRPAPPTRPAPAVPSEPRPAFVIHPDPSMPEEPKPVIVTTPLNQSKILLTQAETLIKRFPEFEKALRPHINNLRWSGKKMADIYEKRIVLNDAIECVNKKIQLRNENKSESSLENPSKKPRKQ